jgi:hypothetical protein
MSPFGSTRDSEREVSDLARSASAYLNAGPIRRFVRDDRARLLADGRAMWQRLDADCRRVEREIATLVQQAWEPRVLDRVGSLTQELDAGRCQLQRLSTVLDELEASDAPRRAHPRRRTGVR